jgi:hypothetical protein
VAIVVHVPLAISVTSTTAIVVGAETTLRISRSCIVSSSLLLLFGRAIVVACCGNNFDY